MRNLIAVLFVLVGFVIAIGSENPQLATSEILIQGFTGLTLVLIGMRIYKGDGDEI